MNTLMNENRKSYWWMSLISGLVLLFFGIWFFVAPLESFQSLTIVFGIVILIIGLSEVFIALKNRKVVLDYMSYLWGGLLNVVLGVLLISSPETILWIISIVIGFWLIFKGGEQIKRAIHLKKQNSNSWKTVLIWGIVLVLIAAALLWHPEIIGITIAIWTAIAFIFIGIFRIYLAFRLREMR
jgi:uncharacterized membrane protein HdeD (DUF308 family)